jgi:hypothetical protein
VRILVRLLLREEKNGEKKLHTDTLNEREIAATDKTGLSMLSIAKTI